MESIVNAEAKREPRKTSNPLAMLIALGFVAWFGWGLLSFAGRVTGLTSDPSAPLASTVAEPSVEVPASLLVWSYAQNEIKADQDFKGRRLLVSGRISKIGKDIADTPYIALDEEEYGLRAVQAVFSDDDLTKLAELHVGQTVKVIGTCDGLMMNVLLKDTVLKSVGP